MSDVELAPRPTPPIGLVPGNPKSAAAAAGTVILAWGLVSVVAGLQVFLGARMDGRALSFGSAWARHLPILALWALATPAVLASARRFPVRGPGAPRALLLHGVAGTVFVVASNLLIRLPGLLPGGVHAGPGDVLAATADGLVRWYPLAMIVYGTIVAAGHRLVPRAPERPAEGETVGGAESEGPLPLRTESGIRLLRPGDVDWIEADGNHVVVHGRHGAHRARERLSDLESALEGRGFARVHRSALVRLECVRELRPISHGDMEVVLDGGQALRLPRSRRAALEERLGVAL